MKHSLLLATLAISLAPYLTHTSLQPLRHAGQRALANASQRTLAGALQQKRMASALTTAHSPSLRKRNNGVQKRSFSQNHDFSDKLAMTGSAIGTISGAMLYPLTLFNPSVSEYLLAVPTGAIGGGLLGIAGGYCLALCALPIVLTHEAYCSVYNSIDTSPPTEPKMLPPVDFKTLKNLSLEQQLMHEFDQQHPDLRRVQDLIEQGVDIRKQLDHNGTLQSPLHRAIKMDHTRLAVLLASHSNGLTDAEREMLLQK